MTAKNKKEKDEATVEVSAKTKDLVVRSEEAVALRSLDPQALMLAAIENGTLSIDTMERLIVLAKDVRAEEAKEAYNHAIAIFQKECPTIKKTERAQIRTRSGSGYNYSYAPLGEILKTVQPVMGPLGLSVSFLVKHDIDRVIAQCRLSHELGHSELSGEVAMPIEKYDGTGANPAQRVGIASTYAKRYALLAIIGIAPEDDPDAANGHNSSNGVSEPQRKSSSLKEQQQVPSAASGDAVQIYEGVVEAVQYRTGETNNQPWTLYTVTMINGEKFKTFDKTAAELAKEAGDSPVRITYKIGARGSAIIETVEPIENDGAPL